MDELYNKFYFHLGMAKIYANEIYDKIGNNNQYKEVQAIKNKLNANIESLCYLIISKED